MRRVRNRGRGVAKVLENDQAQGKNHMGKYFVVLLCFFVSASMIGCIDSPCLDNSGCVPNLYLYCKKDAGNCEGEGVCAEKPSDCPDLFQPVCGCDGNTYSHSCDASAAGVNAFKEGECDCADNTVCQSGFYCAKSVGLCENERGVCTEKPTVCPEAYYPVCGCDAVTYGNPCEAAAAGVNVLHAGEC